jgi:hypothetical protein
MNLCQAEQVSEILMVVTLKVFIFWDVEQYSLVDLYWYFRGAFCVHCEGKWVWNGSMHLLD